MTLKLPVILATLTLAATAVAQSPAVQTPAAQTPATTTPTAATQVATGDPVAGEREFRKCKACHMIRDDQGNDIFKGGKTGPNLYNVVGRKAGTQADFKYSDALVKLGAAGEVWTPDDLSHYVTDPNRYVQERTGDKKLRTKMTFKLAKKQADVVAYLRQNSPAAPAN